MKTLRPLFGEGRLRVSRIVYSTDVSTFGAREIPLGVIADMRVGGVYALGLITRKQLTEQEVALVGPLARRIVATPFPYLRGEFKSVWGPDFREASERAQAFEALPLRHSSALRFENFLESEAKLPTQVALHHEDLGTLRQWAMDTLKATRRAAYWSLLDDYPADGFGSGTNDHRRELHLAA